MIRSSKLTLIVLLGAYLNIIGFGFEYGSGNHQFELALVNWLKDPSLYPGDPITEGFARYPTFFWPIVAYASRWVDTQLVLFIAFLLTKVLFFFALTRLVAKSVQDYRLVACIVCAVALSPLLNSETPFADSDVLNAIQTHTSLAIPLLLWVGCFLVEGRWCSAAVLLGFAVYINGLFALFVLLAFAGFVLVDWRQHKREILLASILLGVIVVPCLALSHGTFPTSFPNDYVEVILMRMPGHFTLRSHSLDELLHGSGIMLVTACMMLLVAKLGVTRHRRLELLTGFFLLPFLLGAFVGELFPVPSLVRLHLLRSDSFLLLYSIILVQIYGGRILLSAQLRSPAAIWLLGVPAILMPLEGFVLLILLLTGMLIVMVPQARFKRLCRHTAWWIVRTLTGVVVLAGVIIDARSFSGMWSPGHIAVFVAVLGVCSAYGGDPMMVSARQGKLAIAVCGLVLVAVTIGSIPGGSRLWNPVIVPTPSETAWREVQQWAKANTPRHAKFLVPPVPGGFRVFSERACWVEWKDGVIIFTVASYASEWLRRMSTIGFRHRQRTRNDYEEQSWEHLRSVARDEKIDYIVQFKEVRYSIPPVFVNERFAVYSVNKSAEIDTFPKREQEHLSSYPLLN